MAKNTEYIEEDAPMTDQEKQEEMLFNEDAILRALTDDNAHEGRIETVEVHLGSAVFRFRIRPLTEKEYDKCRETNTKYSKNRKLGGMRMPENTDITGYHSSLIYTATVDEDKEKIWNNKRLWAAVNALTGVDMVDKLIPYAGKKQAIVELIERISGFDEDADYGDAVKN